MRVGCSPEVMIRSSQYSVARWLTRPSSHAAGDAAGERPLAELAADPVRRHGEAKATRTILRWSRRTDPEALGSPRGLSAYGGGRGLVLGAVADGRRAVS